MGMLLHNTLMEQEAMRKQAEKPVEVPKEETAESEPVKRTGRRKTTNK